MLLINKDKQIRYENMSSEELTEEIKTNNELFWNCMYSSHSSFQKIKNKHPELAELLYSNVNFNLIEKAEGEDLNKIISFFQNNSELTLHLLSINRSFVRLIKKKKMQGVFLKQNILQSLVAMESTNQNFQYLLNKRFLDENSNKIIEKEKDRQEKEIGESIGLEEYYLQEQVNFIVENCTLPNEETTTVIKDILENNARNLQFLNLLNGRTKCLQLMLQRTFVKSILDFAQIETIDFIKCQMMKNNQQISNNINSIILDPSYVKIGFDEVFDLCMKNCIDSKTLENIQLVSNFLKIANREPINENLRNKCINFFSNNMDYLIKLVKENENILDEITELNKIQEFVFTSEQLIELVDAKNKNINMFLKLMQKKNIAVRKDLKNLFETRGIFEDAYTTIQKLKMEQQVEPAMTQHPFNFHNQFDEQLQLIRIQPIQTAQGFNVLQQELLDILTAEQLMSNSVMGQPKQQQSFVKQYPVINEFTLSVKKDYRQQEGALNNFNIIFNGKYDCQIKISSELSQNEYFDKLRKFLQPRQYLIPVLSNNIAVKLTNNKEITEIFDCIKSFCQEESMKQTVENIKNEKLNRQQLRK